MDPSGSNDMKAADRGERLTYTIDEVAQKLGVSRHSAYEAAKNGKIPTIKIGRLLRIPRIPFERLLQGS